MSEITLRAELLNPNGAAHACGLVTKVDCIVSGVCFHLAHTSLISERVPVSELEAIFPEFLVTNHLFVFNLIFSYAHLKGTRLI